MNDTWLRWINSNWQNLAAGAWLEVPSHLPHPRRAGFETLALAEPVGQVADYALPLDDDSRVHVHEHSDGTLVAHRDRFDPGAGPVEAVLHVASETKVGRGLGVLLALFVVGAALAGIASAASARERTP